MVKWPQTCCGCGKVDVSELQNIKYKWRKQMPQTSSEVANNKVYTLYLTVSAYLCKSCKSRALSTFIFRIILLALGLGVGGYLVFDFDLPEWTLWIGIPLMGICMFLLMFSFLKCAGSIPPGFLPREYINIRTRVGREESDLQFYLKNPKFTEHFKHFNPSAIVKKKL
ncbi:MAG: hypothetical protein ACTSUE_20195 [Promethearchaeota archaeon]